jgi:uncharacterized membrane protein YkvA (DUF1232 family)
MSEIDQNYLDSFGAWLQGLGDDAQQLAVLISSSSCPETTRQIVAGGLNYLFKSLDLIPDGIDDIGYLDDGFVLRVSADLAIQEDVGDLDPQLVSVLNRLASDVDTIRDFLGPEYGRLLEYVKGLRKGSARGRSAPDIARDPAALAALTSDVRSFCNGYQAPRFTREEKTLVKLRAFFDAKLPRSLI